MPADSIKARELKLALTLSGVIAFRMLGLFLILPVFMILARDIPGFTAQLGGIAVGVYGLTQAVLQQPFGWLSDRWGRRPVLLLGLSLFAAGGIVAALAPSMSVLIIGRALQGCGAIAGVAMAFAADFTRPERRSISMAIIGLGIGGAFLLSMVLSVPLASLMGLRGLFWLTVVLAIAGVLLIMTVKSAVPASVEVSTPAGNPTNSARVLALSVFLLHAMMTLLFVALPPMLLEKQGLVLSEHWKIYVPAMVGSVVIMFPLLRASGKRHMEHRVLPWAFLALALSLGLMALSTRVSGIVLLITIYFLGFNLLEAAMPALLTRISGSRVRGRRMGTYSSFQFLGAFVGGVIGGWLLGRFGSEYALLAAGGVCLAWGLLLQLMAKRFFLTGEQQRL